MTTQIATGIVLLVLPVAYNVLFTVLARTFDYPDILRQPTKDVLRRFANGGSRLVLTWWGFAMSAVLLAPAVVLLSHTLADANPTVLALATTLGVLAGAAGRDVRGCSFWGAVARGELMHPSPDGAWGALIEGRFAHPEAHVEGHAAVCR